MLKTHIVDLEIGEHAVCQALLDRESGIIGMDMHFDDLFVADAHDGIADGSQIILEFRFRLRRDFSLCEHKELGAVSELDIVG